MIKTLSCTTRMSHVSQSLQGQRIIVTRSSEQQSELTAQLEALGAKVLTMPLLYITAPSSWEPLDQAIAQLAGFQWLLLTSTNAVDCFFARVKFRGGSAQDLNHLRIAVVGTKTCQTLAQYGFTPAVIPTTFDSEGLLIALKPVIQTTDRVLFPRVESGGREVLVQALAEWGAIVIQVPAYESQAPTALTAEVHQALLTQQVDYVTFTSSKTVRHFAQLITGLDLADVKFAAIGPQTAQTCRELLGAVHLEATTYTLEGLVKTLVEKALSQN